MKEEHRQLSSPLMRIHTTLVLLCTPAFLPGRVVLAQCGGPDGFEQNDTCEDPAYTEHGGDDLAVYMNDPDWYRLRVPPQGFVQVDIYFSHAIANVDMRLWDACGGNLISWGNTIDDDEQVVGINFSDEPVDFYCEVHVNPASSGHCNDYDMLVQGAGTNLGANYCQVAVNSTGLAAFMSAEGSLSVAANDVTLFARTVPANQPGIFYYGPQQLEIPFGNGWRCVGPGPVGTFFFPMTKSNPVGDLRTRIDLVHPPAEEGRILPGSTWHFQAWFRDPMAAGHYFSLSDGLTLVFQP